MSFPTRIPGAPALPASGNIRQVFVLAYPVVLTQLATTAMGLVDSAMVGRLGATPLAAVGFGNVWIWTLFSLIYGTANGVQTFVSQADGAGEPERCGAWAWQGAYALLPPTLLTVGALALSIPVLLSWLGTSAALQDDASRYALARLPGEIALAISMVLVSFFRGFGDTRTPLYIAIAANAVNAVLDYGLIFGELGLPAWGVTGAGAATSVGHWFSAAALYVCFRRGRVATRYATDPVGPDRAMLRRFVRTSAPIGGQWCLGMTSFAAFTTLVARMGDVQMAASQAFVMLLSLSFMQALGLSAAASTLVGRYVGARDREAVERSFRSSLLLGGMLSGAVAVLFVAVPEPLLRIFSSDPEVIRLGVPLLALGAFFQLFDAAGIISEGALRGAGDTRWPFVAHTLLGWGFFVPAAYTLGVWLEHGLHGAWIAGTVYVILLSSVMIRRFHSGAWHHVKI